MHTWQHIPRIIHQVWLGSRPIPARFHEWAQEWRVLHPAWQVVLWSDRPELHAGPWQEVRNLPPLCNQWAFENVRTIVGARAAIAAQSDIVRYEIIASHGGIYVDTDVEIFEPLDGFLDEIRLFVADEYGGVCGNYLFGAAPNHPAMWTVVRELFDNFAPIGRRRSRFDRLLGRPGKPVYRGILELTGPNYLATKIQRHPDCVVFPWQIFNALHPRADANQVKGWPAASMGNHHYAGTWYDQVKRPPNDDLSVGDDRFVLEAP